MLSLTQTEASPKLSFAPVQPGMLQHKCACGKSPGLTGECTKCQNKRLTLQRRATNQAESDEVPPIVHEVLREPGQPLDAETRAFMEPRFGHDFSQVRVHTDAKAVASAQAVNALAYTVGRDVVFGAEQYAPSTNTGRRLLAHELAHTVQQEMGNVRTKASLGIFSNSDASETEANVAAEAIMQRRAFSITASGETRVARQPSSSSVPTSPSDPKPSLELSDNQKSLLQHLMCTAKVPLLPNEVALPGNPDEDTIILAEYFLCDSTGYNLLTPVDSDPLLCIVSEVTRTNQVFQEYKKKVIEPEYSKLPPVTPLSQLKYKFQREFECATKIAGVPLSWATDPDLISLVRNESGFNPEAKNPGSPAFGLFQMFPGTWKENLPEVPFGKVDPYWQAVGGFRYIKKAYRNPTRAWQFWQATVRKNANLAPSDLRKKATEWINGKGAGY